MSYSFQVTAKGGQLSVDGVSGDVPEGTFYVGGHSDETWESISVSHASPGFRGALGASASGGARPRIEVAPVASAESAAAEVPVAADATA